MIKPIYTNHYLPIRNSWHGKKTACRSTSSTTGAERRGRVGGGVGQGGPRSGRGPTALLTRRFDNGGRHGGMKRGWNNLVGYMIYGQYSWLITINRG